MIFVISLIVGVAAHLRLCLLCLIDFAGVLLLFLRRLVFRFGSFVVGFWLLCIMIVRFVRVRLWV